MPHATILFLACLRAKNNSELLRPLIFPIKFAPIFTYAFLDSVFIAVLFSCDFSEPSVNERLIARSVSCLDVVITPWPLFIIINLSWTQSAVVCHRSATMDEHLPSLELHL